MRGEEGGEGAEPRASRGQASHLAGGRNRFLRGPCVCTPGWWEGVLFKDYHLIFIFGCGQAC